MQYNNIKRVTIIENAQYNNIITKRIVVTHRKLEAILVDL